MADPSGDLRAHLLLDRREDEVIVDVSNGDAIGNGAVVRRDDGGGEVAENPFEFLGADFPPLRSPSTADPFRNHTLSISGAYEWLKMVVTVPLALIRLVIFGVSLLVGFMATKLALYRWKDKQSPMPRWRCRMMWITRICSRCILFAFGYHWIKRKGKPASRARAPIVVSNHVSFIEPIFFFYELFPTIVASESHDALPFVGTIIRAMQVIYVDRFSPQSRKNAVSEIKRKASCNSFPRLLLFPEGTTTNGRFLISFQLGAFIPGFPVQPVVVRYPYVHFDQSWGNVVLAKLMFRMFTQFHNFMEVEYLPVIDPPERKHENAVHFAEQTSRAMASALNVVQTSYSYGDMILLARAWELTKGKCSNYMIEMAWVESSFNISISEAMELLEQFIAMYPDSNGCVDIYGFLTSFGLGLNPLFAKIFGYFDVENRGYITFRQFLIGSANIRKQPLFWTSCELAFNKCIDSGTGYISKKQLGNIIQSTVPGTSNETVHRFFPSAIVGDCGTVSRDDFMTCLGKNPLLIAFFASFSSENAQ